MRMPGKIPRQQFEKLDALLFTAEANLRLAEKESRGLPQTFTRRLYKIWDQVYRLQAELEALRTQRIGQD